MDPISLAIAGVGLGMQIMGGLGQAKDAEKAAEISKDEARQEQQINVQKQNQMEIEARRTQLENVRNNQRARAMATNSAVSQGAQFGSGLQGGLGQIQDQSMFNMQGVNQAREIGLNISHYNSLITNDKMAMADVQSDSSKNAGIASLGGALMKSSGSIGQLGSGFGSIASSAGSSIFGAVNSGGMLFQ